MEIRSSPAGLTKLRGEFGPADAQDDSRRRPVTIVVQSGNTGSPARYERKFQYGAPRQFEATIRPGEFLRVQATADGPATACLGDVRLDP